VLVRESTAGTTHGEVNEPAQSCDDRRVRAKEVRSRRRSGQQAFRSWRLAIQNESWIWAPQRVRRHRPVFLTSSSLQRTWKALREVRNKVVHGSSWGGEPEWRAGELWQSFRSKSGADAFQQRKFWTFFNSFARAEAFDYAVRPPTPGSTQSRPSQIGRPSLSRHSIESVWRHLLAALSILSERFGDVLEATLASEVGERLRALVSVLVEQVIRFAFTLLASPSTTADAKEFIVHTGTSPPGRSDALLMELLAFDHLFPERETYRDFAFCRRSHRRAGSQWISGWRARRCCEASIQDLGPDARRRSFAGSHASAQQGVGKGAR
jgi:hypothetical protein